LAVLIRKRLEVTPNRGDFSILNLFCTWCVHTEITTSLTGLKTLARVNDVLAGSLPPKGTVVIPEIIAAIGFTALRRELITFLNDVGIRHKYDEEEIWQGLLRHLLEIIRDTAIRFLPVDKLRSDARQIYDRIAKNPTTAGGRVVSIALADIDFSEELKRRGILVPPPPPIPPVGRYFVIKTENGTVFVPLVWD